MNAELACQQCGGPLSWVFAGSGRVVIHGLTVKCRACGHSNYWECWPPEVKH